MAVRNIGDEEAAEILTCSIDRFQDVAFVKRILPGQTNSAENLAKFELIRIRRMIDQGRLAEAAKESAIAAKEAARSARVATVVAFGAFTVAALTLWLSMTLGG